MILARDSASERRRRYETPHKVFVLLKVLIADDRTDVWVICQRIWRRWESGTGYVYNIGNGKWLQAYEAMY